MLKNASFGPTSRRDFPPFSLKPTKKRNKMSIFLFCLERTALCHPERFDNIYTIWILENDIYENDQPFLVIFCTASHIDFAIFIRSCQICKLHPQNMSTFCNNLHIHTPPPSGIKIKMQYYSIVRTAKKSYKTICHDTNPKHQLLPNIIIIIIIYYHYTHSVNIIVFIFLRKLPDFEHSIIVNILLTAEQYYLRF